MRFQFEGKAYFLQFERNHKNVTVMKQRRPQIVKSKYPYTTATLYQILPETGAFGNRKLVAATSVGCLPIDNYSNAAGRLAALRDLSKTIGKLKEFTGQSKGLVAAMWNAYLSRGKQDAIPTTAVRVPEPTTGITLAPAPETVH